MGSSLGGELVNFEGGINDVTTEPLRILYSTTDSVEGVGLGAPSNWVLKIVSFFRHLVGVLCDGHENNLLKLFAALKKERDLCIGSSGK